MPQAVIAPTLVNSWVNAAGNKPAGYWKDQMGIVHVQGMIEGGLVSSSGVIFVLPVGYRTSVGVLFGTTANLAYATVRTQVDGSVIAHNGSNALFSMNFSFKADS